MIMMILFVIVLLIHIQWRYPNLDRTFIRFANFMLVFIWLGLAGLTIARISMVRTNNEAVVIENTVNVYSGPSESFTRLFTIHEGTVLRIQNEEAGWTQITTLSGYSGWVESEVFKRVAF